MVFLSETAVVPTSIRCYFTANMLSVAGTSFRSCIRVYHKDKNGVLHSLENFELSQRILDAISRGERSMPTRCFPRGDLVRLARIGLRGDKEVDLVVEFLWDPKCFMAIVAKAKNAQLRRRVLEMALNRVRRTPILSKILATKKLPACTIRENPYLKSGHPPYENFIQSLLSITDKDVTGRDGLFELFLQSAADEADIEAFTHVERRGVRIVFHGTNHAVMDSILNSGLDPSYRSSNLGCDYFGVDYRTSLLYTKTKTKTVTYGNYKLLVFLIIVAPPNFLPSRGAVTVESNRLQLPLAEITL